MNSANKTPNRTVGNQTAERGYQGRPTAFGGGENTRGGAADASSWPSCAAEDEVLLNGGGENTLASPFAL